MTGAELILQKNKLRKTPMRTAMLTMLLQAHEAVSKKVIEEQLDCNTDRVTVYRTLKTFEDAGIIHSVMDFDGETKYALCSSSCEAGHHHDAHVHFHCSKCGKTKCLEDLPVPKIPASVGVQIDQVQIIAKGICADCQPENA
jgi:Fur family transcriptional regulator, ferric uptake regulator